MLPFTPGSITAVTDPACSIVETRLAGFPEYVTIKNSAGILSVRPGSKDEEKAGPTEGQLLTCIVDTPGGACIIQVTTATITLTHSDPCDSTTINPINFAGALAAQGDLTTHQNGLVSYAGQPSFTIQAQIDANANGFPGEVCGTLLYELAY